MNVHFCSHVKKKKLKFQSHELIKHIINGTCKSKFDK